MHTTVHVTLLIALQIIQFTFSNGQPQYYIVYQKNMWPRFRC